MGAIVQIADGVQAIIEVDGFEYRNSAADEEIRVRMVELVVKREKIERF